MNRVTYNLNQFVCLRECLEDLGWFLVNFDQRVPHLIASKGGVVAVAYGTEKDNWSLFSFSGPSELGGPNLNELAQVFEMFKRREL